MIDLGSMSEWGPPITAIAGLTTTAGNIYLRKATSKQMDNLIEVLKNHGTDAAKTLNTFIEHTTRTSAMLDKIVERSQSQVDLVLKRSGKIK